jgi:hypothetical protein
MEVEPWPTVEVQGELDLIGNGKRRRLQERPRNADMTPMGPRPSSNRENHTRLGWWLMTHDRGGAILIGSVACAVLAADATYVAIRWSGAGTAFGRGVAWGFVGLLFLMLIAKGLGVGSAIRTGRAATRRRARRTNWSLVVLAIVFVLLSFRFANPYGTLLGTFAALALLFAVASFWAIGRARSSS